MHSDLSAPVTLVSHGRSGTSLLQGIFEAHPDVTVAGETSEIIFGTWFSIDRARGIVPELVESGRTVPWNERVARAVRAAFGSLFDLPTPYWMHKPIGQPLLIEQFQREGNSLDEWFELYWQILGDVFPGGSFVTILRHPFDVVLSGAQYWGRDQRRVWSDIATTARCLTHPSSRISYAVSFDELQSDPSRTLPPLFEHVGIPYDPVVLNALDSVYVPNHEGWKQDKSQHDDKVRRGFSRRHQWDSIDESILLPDEIEIVAALWNRHGVELDLPVRH